MESLTLLRMLAVYVVLLALDRLAPGGPIRLLTNVFALVMPVLLVVHWFLRGRPMLLPRGLAIGFGLLVAGLLASAVVSGINNVADYVKYLLAPVFAILGYNASRFDATDAAAVSGLRRVGLVLLVVPLGLIVLQRWVPPPGETEIAFFANRNNAALYMVVLSNVLFLLGVRVPVVVAVLAIVAASFSTLGVMLAVVLALLVSLGIKRYLGAYVAAIAVGAFLLFGPIELPMTERLRTLWEAVSAVTDAGLWGQLDRLSYLDLYRLTGNNSDLSLFFRIKHWEDLIYAWQTSGTASMLFGLGVGTSPDLTDLQLVPHNDYVRFLIETGPLGLLGFAGMGAWFLLKIGRRSVLMSTAAVMIYFFSENLVDNFSAMAMYYYFAGYWAQHAAGTQPAADAAPTEGAADDGAIAVAGIVRAPDRA